MELRLAIVSLPILLGGIPNASAQTYPARPITMLGVEIVPRERQTPDALGGHHKAEVEKWWPMIMAAGIKVE